MSKVIYLIAYLYSQLAFGGHLHCKVTDLATADILLEQTVEIGDLSNIHEPKTLVIQNDFIYHELSFIPENNYINFSLFSRTDYEEQAINKKYQKNDFLKQVIFNPTSIASASLNLDTLYTTCLYNLK